MTEPVIRLRQVGKRYRKYEDSAVLISRGVKRFRRTSRSQIWALRGIDLDIAAGECLGVIGRNGGGKTTMLQLLAGVSAPTEGSVRVRGRVAPLMAVGVGFHPELTGRENVYVNGTILGRTRQELDAVFDDIVSFAEIRDFIDTPVKFYSSGMLVRLGFSVAIRSNPDVLLLDEVLAVGDVAFQARCLDRLQEMLSDGATVVLVSHNLNAVRLLCDRVLVLNAGTPAFLGKPADALSIYHQILDEAREPEVDVAGLGAPQLDLIDERGERTGHISSGDAVAFVANFLEIRRALSANGRAEVELVISSAAGLAVYVERWPADLPPRTVDSLRCELALEARFPGGTYTAVIHLRSSEVHAVIATAGPVTFFVGGQHDVRGFADLGAAVSRADG